MQDLKTRIALIKAPLFRHYLISILFGTFGAGMSYVLLSWAVTRHHHGVPSLVILGLCFWLPSIFVGPAAGVVIDKFQITNKIMSAALGIRALLYALAFIAFSLKILPMSNLLLFIMALISGTALSFYGAAATKYVREIVPHQKLMSANATIDIAYETGYVLGMGLAGFIIALCTLQGTFGVISVIFAVGAMALFTLKPGNIKNKKEAKLGFFKDLSACYQHVKSRPNLLKIAIVQFILLSGLMVGPVLLAPFARQILHASVTEFGGIETALSCGIILGGLISPTLVNLFSFRLVAITQMILIAVGFVLFSFNRDILLAAGLFFIVGLGLSSWPLFVTELQNNTDYKFQGRIQGVLNALSAIGVLLVYSALDIFNKILPLPDIYFIQTGAAIICILVLLTYRQTNSTNDSNFK